MWVLTFIIFFISYINISWFFFFMEIWYVLRHIASVVKEFKRVFTTYICMYVARYFISLFIWVFCFKYTCVCMYIRKYSWQHHRTNQNIHVNQYSLALATHVDNKVEDCADRVNQQIIRQRAVLRRNFHLRRFIIKTSS